MTCTFVHNAQILEEIMCLWYYSKWCWSWL